jgi:hypothetical protein
MVLNIRELESSVGRDGLSLGLMVGDRGHVCIFS